MGIEDNDYPEADSPDIEPLDDGYEEQGDQYEVATLIRRMTSISDPIMRRRQLQRHVISVDAPVFASHLSHIVVHAVRGNAMAGELLMSVSEYIHQAKGRDLLALEAVNLAARTDGHLALGWMLLKPEPVRTVERLVHRQIGRALTLGERKSLASGWDRSRLERLLVDNDVTVIERLVRNPRLLEQHVLLVASRRPTLPELLHVVAREPRWMRRASVREALVQNPYGCTGMALCLLPTIPIPALERLQFAMELHPAIRDFSRYLLELRRGPPTMTQIPDYSGFKPHRVGPDIEKAWRAFGNE